MISTRSNGKVPPLVSQSTSQCAPARAAAASVASAYSRFARKPSKKCSASKMTSSIFGRRKAMVSSIIARFSGSVVPSASVTWKSQDFPTMVATGAPPSMSARMLASDAAVPPARRVMLNAASFACFSVASFGFEPGHPPSM